MKTALACLCVLLLSGCIMDQRMNAFMDKPVDDLYLVYGAPDSERVRKDGSTVLSYSYQWGMGYDGAFTQSRCRMVFVADQAGIIRAWSYSGC